jgi:acetylornithine deacetylase/succinyl-diaminopimelate desuccinylase-like protein
MRMISRTAAVLVLLCVFEACAIAADLIPPAAQRQRVREILAELIALDTTHAKGTAVAAERIAERLRAGGFAKEDVIVFTPKAGKGNLVVRLRGRSKAKPVLFVAHLDVVEVEPLDWSVPPFQLTEKDGVFYGRGVFDIKGEVADLVANLLRLRAENYIPKRDIVVALTSDEESGGDLNGIEWLLAQHRELIDAEFVINPDSGGGDLIGERRTDLRFQTSEKYYATFQALVTNPGGHSSLPTHDNAIYRLAEGLTRLGKFNFPAQLTATARGYFGKLALAETGQVAADMGLVAAGVADEAAIARLGASPLYNATLRTTCVATMLQAGHGESALPQRAMATIQCRIMPGEKLEDVQARLNTVFADSGIVVSVQGYPKPSPESALRPDVLGAVERVAESLWPGVPVIPVMDPWASDSYFFRQAGIPAYGVCGIFADGDNGAHGRDERVSVEGYYQAVEFMYRLMKALTH